MINYDKFILFHAIKKLNSTICERIINENKLEIIYENDSMHCRNVIHNAILYDFTYLFKFIFDKGIYNTENVDIFGHTILHLACIKNNYEVVQFILEINGNVNARNYNNQNALHLAVIKKNTTIVDLLLKYYVNVDLVDNFNYSPIRYAFGNNSKDIVLKLINYNAYVCYTDGYLHKFLIENKTDTELIALLILRICMHNEIYFSEILEFKEFQVFDSYLKEIVNLKTIHIIDELIGSISLFELITSDVDTLIDFVYVKKFTKLNRKFKKYKKLIIYKIQCIIERRNTLDFIINYLKKIFNLEKTNIDIQMLQMLHVIAISFENDFIIEICHSENYICNI